MTGLRSSCGACKFLRRKCNEVCVFAPYFCHEQGASHFAAVHKVFGASNVSKLLTHLPPHNRTDAAVTITYEALARMQDPIYGCVGHIFELQLQVATLQEEIELLETQVSQSSTTVVQVDGTCQTILDNTSTGGVPFSLQPDHMDIYEYDCDGEAALAPSISKEEMAGLANGIDDSMGLQQVPSTCIWGESSAPLDSVNGLKTSQAGEMEIQEIFTQELSWLDDSVYLSSLLASFNS